MDKGYLERAILLVLAAPLLLAGCGGGGSGGDGSDKDFVLSTSHMTFTAQGIQHQPRRRW